MTRSILAIIFSLCLANHAEAKNRYEIDIIPTENQVDQWQNGIHYVDDIQKYSIARVVSIHDDLPDKQSTFRVFIKNNSGEALLFGPENITIEYDNIYHIAMFTHEELEGRLRRDIKRRKALAAFGSALSSSAANGYTTGTFDYSGITTHGSSFNGSGTYSTYDPALAQQQQRTVQKRSAEVSKAIEARQLSGKQALDGLIRRETVPPSTGTGGIAAYDAPPAFKRLDDTASITIVIKVGEDEHRIAAKLRKIE